MMLSHFGGPGCDFEVSSRLSDFNDFIAKSLQKMDTARAINIDQERFGDQN